MMKKACLWLLTCGWVSWGALGSITVSDVSVFSGYTWKGVAVGYTITGTDANADGIRLTVTDKARNQSYTVMTGMSSLSGASFSEGRHVLHWNAAADGVQLATTNVVFTVSVVEMGVQLWKDGPYWAECNVGAAKPEEYGYYFWWGDTVGYKRVGSSWNAVDGSKTGFSFSSGNCPTYGKDNATLKTKGYIDATGNLVANYDAATKYLGTPWRMPTDAEWTALISNCTTTWTTRNGVYGRLVTGRGTYASKSIFLPAAGGGDGSDLGSAGSSGNAWSSAPYSDDSSYAWGLSFGSSYFGRGGNYRYRGRSVRPLRGVAK